MSLRVELSALDDKQRWLEHGHRKGWVSKVFCDTHDGPPMTDVEYAAWEDGEDRCMWMVRVRGDDAPMTGGREGWPT